VPFPLVVKLCHIICTCVASYMFNVHRFRWYTLYYWIQYWIDRRWVSFTKCWTLQSFSKLSQMCSKNAPPSLTRKTLQ